MPLSERDKAIQNELADAMPLDFSFKKITNLTDDPSDKPREGRVGKTPARGQNKRFMTKSLWLDNNYLTSLVGIEHYVNNSLEYPETISWIDFSFNNIKDIDAEITKFKNLLILYFHGNAIENIESTFKLRDLPKLKRLTLHGNPVTETPLYRQIIIHLLPQLHNLDFAPIVKREKNSPVPAILVKKLNFSPY